MCYSVARRLKYFPTIHLAHSQALPSLTDQILCSFIHSFINFKITQLFGHPLTHSLTHKINPLTPYNQRYIHTNKQTNTKRGNEDKLKKRVSLDKSKFPCTHRPCPASNNKVVLGDKDGVKSISRGRMLNQRL